MNMGLLSVVVASYERHGLPYRRPMIIRTGVRGARTLRDRVPLALAEELMHLLAESLGYTVTKAVQP